MQSSAKIFKLQDECRCAILLDWEDGILSRAEGNLVAAAEKIERSFAAAARVGDVAFQRIAIGILADVLAKLDKVRTVIELLTQSEPLLKDANECTKSTMLRNLSFALLHLPIRLTDKGQMIAIDNRPIYDIFLRAWRSKQQCQDDSSTASLFKGLAFISLLENRQTDAENWISKAIKLKYISAVDELDLIELKALLSLERKDSREAKQLFWILKQRSQKYPKHFQYRIECTVAVGIMQSLQLAGEVSTLINSQVNSCLTGDLSRLLDPSERRFLVLRATRAHFMDAKVP